MDYQVDSIVTASVAMSSDLSRKCLQAGVPVVHFNCFEDDHGVASVASDNFAGGRELAGFLVAGEHEKSWFWTPRGRKGLILKHSPKLGLHLSARELKKSGAYCPLRTGIRLGN